MIIVFTCTAKDCPNEGIEYRMEQTNKKTMCGGCKATLTGTVEENNG